MGKKSERGIFCRANKAPNNTSKQEKKDKTERIRNNKWWENGNKTMIHYPQPRNRNQMNHKRPKRKQNPFVSQYRRIQSRKAAKGVLTWYRSGLGRRSDSAAIRERNLRSATEEGERRGRFRSTRGGEKAERVGGKGAQVCVVAVASPLGSKHKRSIRAFGGVVRSLARMAPSFSATPFIYPCET